MCVEDVKIARRTRYSRQVVVLDVNGLGAVPSPNTIYLMYFSSASATTTAVTPDGVGGFTPVPRSILYSVSGIGSNVHTWDGIAGCAEAGLSIQGLALDTVTIHRWDFETDVVNAINQPLKG